MTTDVRLPTRAVLDSTIAYREAGRPGGPVALFLHGNPTVGDPGALTSPAFAEQFAARLRNCTVVWLGPGAHYPQEDHPERIGRSVAQWMAGIEAGRRNHTAA